jgi:hypothetical protein
MEIEGRKKESNDGEEQGTTNQAGVPSPIICTSAKNLLQLQKHIRGIGKGSSEFRNTKNGTRALAKVMTIFSAIKSFSPSYGTSFPKSYKPIKTIIRRLPPKKHTEEIYEVLVEPGFDVISVKQIVNTRRSRSEDTEKSSPRLFLHNSSQDTFKTRPLSHIYHGGGIQKPE